tara:strand:- start:892 stop:1650 length:759 start_codon:yes stop_codon:yes gene_type:complete
MSRKITSGISGRSVLGSLTALDNSLQSVVVNANLVLDPNGTGIVQSTAHLQLNAASSLRLADGDSSAYVALKSPTTLATTYTLTMPPNDGANTQMLQTDGSGVLTWAAPVIAIANQLSDSATYYPTLVNAITGTTTGVSTSSTKLSFQPSTGTLTTTALVETSSIALKENVIPIENALESLLKLTGVIYDRKDGSTKNEAGLIAEDVNKVLPNLVTKDENGNPFGINYTKFSAYLIEAVKTLSAQLNELKQR